MSRLTDRLYDFHKSEIIEIVDLYDEYIDEFMQYGDVNNVPVCLEEFIDNEYEFMKENEIMEATQLGKLVIKIEL